ncbi:uncharacterized protein LOC130956698 [Arachis stenosperma]|uniref:uncharacterized protein LOC130956698 n=1 Tax=Arachis stenosperma TaxID=217475 RepID=UPI0025ABE396|nr:uncharacterized protein LOC130956698 [Arachis stenosperma]
MDGSIGMAGSNAEGGTTCTESNRCNYDVDGVCNTDVGIDGDDPLVEDELDYDDVIGLTGEDICKKVFCCEQRAYHFFMRIGKCHEFGVQKGDYRKNEDGNLIRRRFFFNRMVNLVHNHALTLKVTVDMIPEFCRISDGAKAQIDGMQCYGQPTSKILGYKAGIKGGYSLLGFTKKDAYNNIDKTKWKKNVDGDPNAALIYLEGKATADTIRWLGII